MLVSNIVELSKADDPKAAILASVGGIEDVEVFNSDLLVATYARPDRTAGGIYLSQKQSEEDKYQGKVALILKMGPEAFLFNKHSGAWAGRRGEVGDWVVFRASDGWDAHLRSVDPKESKGVHVRFVPSELIRAIVDDPLKFY